MYLYTKGDMNPLLHVRYFGYYRHGLGTKAVCFRDLNAYY